MCIHLNRKRKAYDYGKTFAVKEREDNGNGKENS